MSTQPDSKPHPRTFAVLAILGAAALALVLLFFTDRGSEPPEQDVAELPPLVATEIHSGLSYPLDEVAQRKAVPALFIDAIEVNLDRIRDIAEKKATFFRIMLPHIARENDRIRDERTKISAKPVKAPAKLYDKYGVDPGDIKELLKRVDVIPASLVLAQVALESGWGTSRFARHGNNFFGMRTYNMDAKGIDPKQADRFKVMVFKDIAASVRAYMRNLNTHAAYTKFRQARAEQRAQGRPPSGRAMTNFLTAYSEIPEKYGARLRGMMDRNSLDRFDGVRVARD
jgi:Bax protein